MNKVLIAVSSFAEYDKKPLDILKEEGLNIVPNPYGRRPREEEIIDSGKECVGIVAGLEFYSKKVLKALPRLKVISRVGTGIANIHLKTARELGIEVRKTPDAPTQAVAELAIGLIFNLLRKIHQMDRLMKQGEWKRFSGNLIKGKTIGIIGYGRIGKRVARLLKGFGVSIMAYDKVNSVKVLHDDKVKRVFLNELLKKSDIVMLHLSGECRIIGKRELDLMKKTAYIVNLSRGCVIDERALYDALKNKKITGAALDVFQKEPYNGPLRELENVILTPHVGSHTVESRIAMEYEAVRNLLDSLKVCGGI